MAMMVMLLVFSIRYQETDDDDDDDDDDGNVAGIQHKISGDCLRLLESTAPARQEVPASSLSSAFPYSIIHHLKPFFLMFISIDHNTHQW